MPAPSGAPPRAETRPATIIGAVIAGLMAMIAASWFVVYQIRAGANYVGVMAWTVLSAPLWLSAACYIGVLIGRRWPRG